MDVSNGVLTLGTSYAPRLFSEPVKSDGKITKSLQDPAGGTMEFIGLAQWCVRTHRPTHPCYYRLVQCQARWECRRKRRKTDIVRRFYWLAGPSQMYHQRTPSGRKRLSKRSVDYAVATSKQASTLIAVLCKCRLLALSGYAVTVHRFPIFPTNRTLPSASVGSRL